MPAFVTADGRTEASANLRLAAPLILAQLSFVGVGVVDTVMAGHISPTALAAIAVGHNLWSIPFMGFLGLFAAVSPIVAHRVGAGQPRERIGDFARQAVALALVLGVLWIGLVQAIARPVLEQLGLPEATTDLAVDYLKAESFSAFFLALCFAQRNVIEGQGYSRPILFAGVCGLVAKIAGNFALIDGRFGLPAFGVVGCGWSTVFSAFTMAAVYFVQLNVLRHQVPLKVYRAWPQLSGEVLEIFRVGIPIAFIFMAEGALFGSSALLMAHFGEAAVAAHQVAINVASVSFMVPMGLGMATTVRVGQAAGASNHGLARRAGKIGMGLGLAYALFSASVMFLVPGAIAGLYTSESGVLSFAAHLLMYAALFQLFDCLQVTASGALRGLKDTRVPMLVTIGAYWGVGFPIAWGLAFRSDFGPAGIWCGLVAGLAAAALGLALRFHLKSRASVLMP